MRSNLSHVPKLSVPRAWLIDIYQPVVSKSAGGIRMYPMFPCGPHVLGQDFKIYRAQSAANGETRRVELDLRTLTTIRKRRVCIVWIFHAAERKGTRFRSWETITITGPEMFRASSVVRSRGWDDRGYSEFVLILQLSRVNIVVVKPTLVWLWVIFSEPSAASFALCFSTPSRIINGSTFPFFRLFTSIFV